ncbi:GerAB/ArcD/ProY family transporter [Paenibacillus physcomitrellae]|uniref:Spore germination protein KB n=1 Tax=Paenibacillus physcomitrellae TaxID=1619311 RepID=A0ABQ1GPM4_9BACL|nr:endospore germination permease [Paenibacillus physcomitrellae]GGA47644.1 spore germination protein KB [Paenibacillus physcomitrellae]
MLRISKYQLFAMVVIFQLGTTIIFGFASSAGRDAWISSLMTTALGSILVGCYVLIFRLTGELSLVEWPTAMFGKWIGMPIAWLYPFVFIYDGARIVSDIRFLFPITVLHGTPNWIIGVTFLLVVAYALYSGFEVIARMTSLFLPLLLVFLIAETLLLWLSDRVDLLNLLPIMGEGWDRVLKTIWPLGITQTFGETIEFAVFWEYLESKGKKSLGRIMISGCLLSGFCITLFILLGSVCMGESIYKQMMYPAFALLKLANIADLLDNLDAVGIIYLVITAFGKLSLHLFAAVFCIQKLLKAQKYGFIIAIVCSLTYFISLTMVVSFTDHLQVAINVLPSRIWLPLFLYLPFLFLGATLLKKIIQGARS